MKVKFFDFQDGISDDETKIINDFMHTVKIIDVKTNVTYEGPKQDFDCMRYSVMVIYEDESLV